MEARVSVIATDFSPKELDKVELTVIFSEHNAKITGSFDKNYIH